MPHDGWDELAGFNRAMEANRLPASSIAAKYEARAQQAAERAREDDEPLEIVDPRAWTKPPQPRRWVVEDWIPRGLVTGLYGDGGVGKSLLAQQLLSSVALGLPWVGLPTVPGRAIGFLCEDPPDEIERRQWDINASLGVEPENLENLRIIPRFGKDNWLMRFDPGTGEGLRTRLFEKLEKELAAFRPDLVVFDTLADVFGGREIDRQHARQFVQGALGRLARTFGCGVLVCAHPSQTGRRDGTGESGSTGWNNSFRSRLYLSRPDGAGANPDARILSRMKANYAARDARVDLVWRRGAFVVPDPADAPTEASWAHISWMFEQLADAWSRKRPWSHRPEVRRDGRYFPAFVREQLGLPEQITEKLLAAWLQNHCLAYEVFDSHSKAKGLRVLRRIDYEHQREAA